MSVRLLRAHWTRAPVFLLVALALACSASEPDASVAVRWAFAGLVEEADGTRLVQVRDGQVLHSGDRLKALIEPLSPCRVYLIHRGPAGDVRLVFPASAARLGAALTPSRTYEVPPGDGWLELDRETGPETYHLLASAGRLPALERLLGEHDAASGAAREALAAQLRDELDGLIGRYASLTRPAQKPATIGGTVRGAEEGWREQLRGMAVEIRGQTAVGRTLVIDHR